MELLWSAAASFHTPQKVWIMSGSDKTAVETGGQQTSSGGAVKFNLRTTGIVAAGNSFFLGYHQPFQIMGNALTKDTIAGYT